MRGASSQEDALTHVFYLRKANLVKQQGDMELFDLSVRKFKGNPSNETFRLQRDPVTKRNTLLNARPAKGLYPSMEEKASLWAKIHRVQEGNPKFGFDVCVRQVAVMEGIPEETLKRWLT